MALALNDRVQQTGTANTIVSFTLTGAVPSFQSFAVVGNGNTTYYSATDASGNWEVGIGTYSTTGPTLTRTTILSSSNAGSAVTFSGTVNVFVTYPSSKSINYDANGVATIGSTLGYSDTGVIGSFASTVAGYNQVVLQNLSNATNASTNFNVSNNVGTSGSNYAELGINSSTFTGTGSLNLAGAAYLASASTDLAIGTYGAYPIHFVTNSGTTDTATIYSGGGMSLNGATDPGLGNIKFNNFISGFAATTAAAGTTTLTNISARTQVLVGSTTQTFRLPDATTLSLGQSFIFINNSSGNLTVVNNASTVVELVPPGGVTQLGATSIATSAGTFGAYSFIPAACDWGTNSLNLATTIVSGGTWQGGTIQSGYGGTGLTTFAAANNAIYSTSASTLAAGTLPAAAGGTGLTASGASGNILTSNGTTWVSSTPTASVTSVTGTANQVTVTGTTTVTLSTPSTFIAPGSIAATTSVTGTVLNATNGIVVNSNSVSASYSIPSGSSAMSAGPITVNSGVVVQIPAGSRWVIL